MNAIFDKEGQFVCVIRNKAIADMRAQELRGHAEAIEETPGSSPPEFLTKSIPGAVIMRAGGVEWVRRAPFVALQTELKKVDELTRAEGVEKVLETMPILDAIPMTNLAEAAEANAQTVMDRQRRQRKGAESGLVIENG